MRNPLTRNALIWKLLVCACANLTLCGPGAKFSLSSGITGDIALSRRRKHRLSVDLSRREFLQSLGQSAACSFLPAGLAFLPFSETFQIRSSSPSAAEFHVHPHYRAPRELENLFKQVQAGSDAFVTEKYQDAVAGILAGWSAQLLETPQATGKIARAMSEKFAGARAKATQSRPARADSETLKVWRLQFGNDSLLPQAAFLEEWRSSMSGFSKLLTAEFQVTSIRAGAETNSTSGGAASLETRVRFEFVGTGTGFFREQRVGHWALDWQMNATGELRLAKWLMLEETRSRSLSPVFVDIASQAFSGVASFGQQLTPGVDHWRTVLDGACGIDIYGHNGVSVGDIDGDGFDDLYVCQPAGLPNRLYRNRGDGTFEDVTEGSGVGILENTACALFADIDNDGHQDLIAVRANGPLLFMNDGGGKFREKPDAFRFATPPQGTFTGAAMADYDRDGWLDIYFSLYVYYQGADQYRYPCPYFDADNGPPNFLMRNERNGTFRDVTRETKLDVNNTRFSFCCGWGDYNGDGWPDLYVVNDFGRKNLYRNNGDGTFTDVAEETGVADVGAGMSVSWLDYDNDGKPDLYIGNMWTAAGNRITEQDIFQKNAGEKARLLYRKHAMGNSLYRNVGTQGFEDDTSGANAGMGRWSWSSDSWDFDQDGFSDLYIANGMISGPKGDDLNSFFWRQVVANSPQDAKPNREYELGWNAINELIRADGTWSGYERNVFYVNNRDGTFSDVSGVVGLDFIEDSRTFALADFDHDGRVEVLLKNRSGPQVRLLKNMMPEVGGAIAFRLQGKKSNRDAIGAAVTVETAAGKQTKFVQAGSGFLAQHSKELFFGLGEQKGPVKASIRWPSGLVQNLDGLPIGQRILVQEGAAPKFESFRAAPLGSAAPTASKIGGVELPESIATWLLAPVAAPEFSISDLSGKTQTLGAVRGKPVLLYFWTTASPSCQKDLQTFERVYARWKNQGLQVLAMNVDDSGNSEPTANLDSFRSLSLPVLRSTQDVVAIYNILFRSLFDRHRDMPLPCSFLLDAHGTIAKIYQGAISLQQIEMDARSIPQTAAERMAKALPFPGVMGNYEFGRNYLSYGSVYFERGYLEPAEAFFELAQRDDPSASEAYYCLGSVYLQQQKSSEARQSFQRAVELKPNYPGTLQRAWNNLGILVAREGKTAEAIENFQQSLKIDPSYLVALDNLGNAYRQGKQWDKAKEAFERALQSNSDDPEANYGLGLIAGQTDQPETAEQFFHKALAARPVYPEALNNLGVLYLRTRRPEQAEKSFQESIRVAPEFEQSYLNLARLYAIEGDTAKARAILVDLLKQHPDNPQAQKELAQLAP
jgi:tetratricopeptide (TPR) repeat protein